MQAQSMSFVRALHTYSKYSLKSRVINWLSNSSLHPPYTHVVPIGDPVLRVATKDVDLDRITSNEIQKIIDNIQNDNDFVVHERDFEQLVNLPLQCDAD